nr:unnamed protein product [Spirometra erinaceieuropaei]
MPSRIAEWLRPRSSALKLYLFFINLLFLLFGIALIAVSIYVSLNRANTPELVGNYLFNAAVYVVLFAIILLFVTSLVGHFAIAKYSRVLLLLVSHTLF